MKKSTISRTSFAFALLGSTLLAPHVNAGKIAGVFGDFALSEDHAARGSQKSQVENIGAAKADRGGKGHGVDTSAGGFDGFIGKAAALMANDDVTTAALIAKANKKDFQKHAINLGKDFAVSALQKAIMDGVSGVEVTGKVNTANFRKFIDAEVRRVTDAANRAAGGLAGSLNALSGAYKQLAPQTGGADALENLKGLEVIKMAHGFGMFKAFQADPTQVMADFDANPEAAWGKYSRGAGDFAKNQKAIGEFVNAMHANADTLKNEGWQEKLAADAGNFSYAIGGFDWNLFNRMENVAHASIQKRNALKAWDDAKALVPGAIAAIQAKAEEINSGAPAPSAVALSSPSSDPSASSMRRLNESE